MGTRGVTGFILDKKWYVTYNHFDSYPEYLGMQVLEFCKSVTKWTDVKEKVRKVKLVNTDVPPTDDEVRMYLKYLDLNVSNQSSTDWYCLLREAQGVGILYGIASGEIFHMIDSHAFMGDSLFCEWGYIIDLDEMKLRVYKGFNTAPVDDNSTLPLDVMGDRYKSDEITTYYAVRELHAYHLNRLPEFMLGVTKAFKEDYRQKKSVEEVFSREINL